MDERPFTPKHGNQRGFPFSMENIPRQKSCICLSLRLASIITALLVILYSVMALAEFIAVLGNLMIASSTKSESQVVMLYLVFITNTVVHTVTLFLSAIMLVGVIQENPNLIRPWVTWMSMVVMALLLVFVYSTTMDMIHSFANSSMLGYLIDVLCLLIRFYMLMLVGSFYKELVEFQNEGKKIAIDEYWYEA